MLDARLKARRIPVPMRMLLQLPLDVQERVYRMLPVDDRARLVAALPKGEPLRARALPTGASRRAERTLGVIHRAVRKRRVMRMSTRMKDFLASVPLDDPTMFDIAASFPDVATARDANAVRPSDVHTLAAGDIERILRTASWETWCTLRSNPALEPGADSLPHLLFICGLYNSPLFVRIAESGAYDLNAMMKSSIKHLSCNPKSLSAVLRHVPMARDELEAVYVYCIERLYIESASIVENTLGRSCA